jgi:hypothetical protein
MRPRAADSEWSQRIAVKLAAQRRSDRTLIGAMSLGAVAACVIVSMLIVQSPNLTPSSPTMAAIPQAPHFGDDLPALARASGLEAWK